MNPAALKVNLADLKLNGILVVNVDNFKDMDLRKAQMTTSPLEDHSLDGYRLFPVELTKLTRAALSDVGLDAKSMDRCKNFFALGMCYWLFNRSLEATERWLDEKFRAKPILAEANKLALKAGYAYCDATQAFQVRYEVPPAKLAPGSTATSPATPRSPWASWPPRTRRGCRSSRAATRSPRPPTSCTS